MLGWWNYFKVDGVGATTAYFIGWVSFYALKKLDRVLFFMVESSMSSYKRSRLDIVFKGITHLAVNKLQSYFKVLCTLLTSTKLAFFTLGTAGDIAF